MFLFLIVSFITSSYGATSFYSAEVVPLSNPSLCADDEYFDAQQLRCISCKKELQLQPAADGLSCECNDRSRIANWNASVPTCSLCGVYEVPTLDQRNCITCPSENVIQGENGTICEHFSCPDNSISVDRHPNGTLLDRILCIKCPKGMIPTLDGRECVPCNNSANCCNPQLPCPSLDKLNWPVEDATFTITFQNGHKIVSPLLMKRLRLSVYLCQHSKQLSACQEVANLCVLVLYDDDYNTSPCVVFRNSKRIPPTLGISALPWIYYGDGDAPVVLSRRRITSAYSLNSRSPTSRLNFTASFFSPAGKFIRMKVIKGSDLQMCPGLWPQQDRSFSFLTPYKLSCKLPVSQLLFQRTTEFMDLYLSFKDGNSEVLHAVPVLIRNMPENRQYDRTQWLLVRRFFLIDTISNPDIVRVASSIAIHVRLQGRKEAGLIHVPLLTIQYTELSAEDIKNNIDVPLEFQVFYDIPGSLAHTIEVSLGVVSALAIVWAGIRTWSHSKRSGHLAIDLFTVGHLGLFVCGYLANVFFIISFASCLVIFVFFKGQSAVHILLPTAAEEDLIRVYVTTAFFLKLVEVGYLVYNQISVDIFLVDWERPRGGTDHPVSIWRTYFVANEWNEIQTKRKINLNLHLVSTIVLLQVMGLEHWSSAEPQLHAASSHHVGIPSSFTCRFATGGLVYLVVYLIQWLVISTVYERYVRDCIREFVDLCSMANISVFILTQARYGYYIHGRSAHGFADTDLLNIMTQLQREEEDLVGHRGLLPGTEQQTFEMTVPAALREYYDKVMTPLNGMSQRVRVRGRTKKGKDSAERSVEGYHNLNRFLGAFLDHALKDLDYDVREKMFAESLLGIEFTDGTEKGILYSDNGHSFDQVLWYGNEMTLLTFDFLVFTYVQLISNDFLLAAAVTGLVAHLLVEVRRIGARQNLAKKTLTDDRFLI